MGGLLLNGRYGGYLNVFTIFYFYFYVCYSCLKDLSMFKKGRKLINKASRYESITDEEDGREGQTRSPDSPYSDITGDDLHVIPDSEGRNV